MTTNILANSILKSCFEKQFLIFLRIKNAFDKNKASNKDPNKILKLRMVAETIRTWKGRFLKEEKKKSWWRVSYCVL